MVERPNRVRIVVPTEPTEPGSEKKPQTGQTGTRQTKFTKEELIAMSIRESCVRAAAEGWERLFSN